MHVKFVVVWLMIIEVGTNGNPHGLGTLALIDTTVVWDDRTTTSMSTDHGPELVVTRSALEVNPARSETNRGMVNSSTPETHGWRWHQLTWSWWIVLEMILAALGFFGNMLIVVVVFQRRFENRSMDTLIGALAVADALTSFFLLPWPKASVVPDTWVGHFYCKVMYRGMFKWISINASIYTMVAISFDRYLAIVHPFFFRRLVSKKKVNTLIILVWVTVGGVIAGGEMSPAWFDGSFRNCVFSFASPEARLVYGCYVFVARLVLPTLIMFVTQVLIARVLVRQSKRFSGDTLSKATGSSTHLVARERVIKMMLVVIILYVICWAPNQFFFFGLNIGFVPYSYLDTSLHRLLILLAFVNSCANPFIYAARHKGFRLALKHLLTGNKKRDRTPVFGENEPVNSK